MLHAGCPVNLLMGDSIRDNRYGRQGAWIEKRLIQGLATMGVAERRLAATIENTASVEVLALVHAALDPDGTASLADLLGRVAAAAGAVGCVLWEAVPSLPGDGWCVETPCSCWSPGSRIRSGRRRGTAGFLRGMTCRSPTPCPAGRSRRAGRPVPRTLPSVECGARTGVSGRDPRDDRVCFPCLASRCPRRTPSLYRSDSRAFTAAEVDHLGEFVRLIPPLYQAMRDCASFTLLKDIEKELQTADAETKGRVLSKDEQRDLIQRLCERVARTINCLEVSVYLNDRLDDPQNYRRMGSTLREDAPIGEDLYRKTEQGDGLTGWVLYHASPIRIFDLRTFDRDGKYYDESYPNIRWKDQRNIKEKALREFGLDQTQEAKLPPLSVLAAPIIAGSEAIGVIRCAVARGPFYFAKCDERLLKVVADQIAQSWNIWLSRREVEQENEAWRKFVDGTRTLNEFVQSEADKENPDEIKIFEEALRLVLRVIPDADSTSIRVHNVRYNVLQFAAILPRPRDNAYTRRMFPLQVEGKPSSAGRTSCTHGRLYEIPEVDRDPYYVKEGLPGVRRMVIAPLTTNNDPTNRFGVIDLRGMGSERSRGMWVRSSSCSGVNSECTIAWSRRSSISGSNSGLAARHGRICPTSSSRQSSWRRNGRMCAYASPNHGGPTTPARKDPFSTRRFSPSAACAAKPTA